VGRPKIAECECGEWVLGRKGAAGIGPWCCVVETRLQGEERNKVPVEKGDRPLACPHAAYLLVRVKELIRKN
jgi:hypothetical protein